MIAELQSPSNLTASRAKWGQTHHRMTSWTRPNWWECWSVCWQQLERRHLCTNDHQPHAQKLQQRLAQPSDAEQKCPSTKLEAPAQLLSIHGFASLDEQKARWPGLHQDHQVALQLSWFVPAGCRKSRVRSFEVCLFDFQLLRSHLVSMFFIYQHFIEFKKYVQKYSKKT